MSIRDNLSDVWLGLLWRLIATDSHVWVGSLRVYDVPGGEKELRLTAESYSAALRLLERATPAMHDSVMQELRSVGRVRDGRPEGVILGPRAYVTPMDWESRPTTRVLAGRLVMAACAIRERHRGRSWREAMDAAEREISSFDEAVRGESEGDGGR